MADQGEDSSRYGSRSSVSINEQAPSDGNYPWTEDSYMIYDTVTQQNDHFVGKTGTWQQVRPVLLVGSGLFRGTSTTGSSSIPTGLWLS